MSAITTESHLNGDLNRLLLELARYGKPSAMMTESGWSVSIRMNTNTTGASFEIRSEFGMTSPLEAAQQCQERAISAIKTLGAT